MDTVKQELEAIKDALKALPGVRLVCTGWPKTFDTLPCVLVQLAGEDGADRRDDGEYLTRLEWYVRVFARKESEQWALCGGVEEAMARLGYRRTFHWEEGMADVRHTAYRFEKTI